VRLYLSPDQQRGGNDTMLVGQQTVSSLRIGRQQTRSLIVVVPAGVPRGLYHLFACGDDLRRVRESDENNCRVSAQRLGVMTSERGPIGANGAPGGPGTPGVGLDVRRIPRTELDLGRETVDEVAFPDAVSQGSGEPDEGSTQTRELIRVGKLRLVALCRQTTNGDDEPPGDDFEDVDDFDEDGDEAKILVFGDDGTLNFRGQTGPRMNVPGGEGTPGSDGEDGGEGKRQVVAVMRDPDPNTTAADVEGEGPNDFEWRFAFRSSSATIVHSGGTQIIFNGWAGIDVLGIGDKCAFGGVVEVVQG
jgi:hypothetical protein